MTEINLGDVARDAITGFEGIVVARTEWLYGCRRFTLQPQGLHDGKPLETATFDEPQLVLVTSRGRAGVPVPESADAGGGPRPEPVRGR